MSYEMIKRVTCDICGTEWDTDEDDRFTYGVLVATEGLRHRTLALDLCPKCLDKATVIGEQVLTEPTGHTLPPDFYEPEMRVVGKRYSWRSA